jgi:DNA-directed RNA polymerase alpha subunit
MSCPTAVINAPVDVVWALLIEPAAWGRRVISLSGGMARHSGESSVEPKARRGTRCLALSAQPNDALQAERMAAINRKKPAMIDPSPELPDDMSIANVELPFKVQQALTAAGLTTVGDVREAPDTKILQIQDLGASSLALLRKTLGLPSSLGVRCDASPTQTRNNHGDG